MRNTLFRKRKDIGNLASLAFIQGANALFPILVFPYLFIVLGEVNFSFIVVSEALAFFILTVSLYSFDAIGIKYIVEAEAENSSSLSDYFWKINFTRLSLFITSSFFFSLFIYYFNNEYLLFFLAWLPFPLGMVLQNNYFFQAKEKNLALAIAVVISRIVSVAVIFLYVENETNTVWTILCVSLSYLISGIASLLYLCQSESLKLYIPKTSEVLDIISSGKVVFLGFMSVMLFRGSNTLILATVIGDPEAVSLYSLAEKYIKMAQALVRPLNQIFFPKAVRQLIGVKTKDQALKVLWNNTKYQLLLTFVFILFFLGFIYFDIYIFHIFFRTDLAMLIFIMVSAVFFGLSNYMIGTVGLITLHAEWYYSTAISIVGVISILLCFLLSYYLSETGAAITYLMSETLLFVIFISFYKKSP